MDGGIVMRRLPKRFPENSKYVVESCGSMVRRYVVMPDGRRFDLPPRKAVTCTCADRTTSIVPAQESTDAPARDRREFV